MVRMGPIGAEGPHGAIRIAGTFIRFVVGHPMGVQAQREAGFVAEMHHDRVAHLGAENRPERAEMLFSRARAANPHPITHLLAGELGTIEQRVEVRPVGAEHGLAIDPTDAVGPRLEKHQFLLPERCGRHPIDRIGGGIIPKIFLRLDPVLP